MILALTGAGISKASGIPTFDEMGNLRSKLDRFYANEHRDDFEDTMSFLKNTCDKCEPNDAHLALAEYGIPVLTMNIDSLHSKANERMNKSKNYICEMHGSLKNNNVVLYGDMAPNYAEATDMVRRLREGDLFLIVGTSYYTRISSMLRDIAYMTGADVIEINSHAEYKVRELIENNVDKLEDIKIFLNREILF